jgi:cobalamin biosynthesis Mg chelatase CobN
MRILRKTLFLSLAFGLSLIALSLTTSGSASAATEADSYIYTAKSGDSYTELARSSVIKYDQGNNEIELGIAQVTAAETWVTQEAGSPAINVGQSVSVPKASVEKFAKQAAALNDAAKARWQTYANASSISVGELKDKVKATTSEDTTAQAQTESNTADDATEGEGTQTDEAQTEATTDEAKTEDNNDDKKSSRRWIVIAIVVLLVLAAVILIRSSNARDEE